MRINPPVQILFRVREGVLHIQPSAGHFCIALEHNDKELYHGSGSPILKVPLDSITTSCVFTCVVNDRDALGLYHFPTNILRRYVPSEAFTEAAETINEFRGSDPNRRARTAAEARVHTAPRTFYEQAIRAAMERRINPKTPTWFDID